MKARIIMIIMGVALMALPTMAQQQQTWKSTSTMPGAGSAYSTQVTVVGATSVQSMATTTASYSPTQGPNRAKKTIEDDTDPGQLDEGSPIGDAVLPLSLMAVAFCGIVYLRRRKRAVKAPSV